MLQNERHKAFCRYYVESDNKRDSYCRAYPNCSPESATVLANNLLNKPEIQAYINKLRLKAERQAVLSVLERQAILANIALSDDTRNADKIKAIDLINKMTALYTAKNLEAVEEAQAKQREANPLQDLNPAALVKLLNEL